MHFIAYMLLSRYLHLYYYSNKYKCIKNTFLKIFFYFPTYLPTPGWESRVWGNKQYFNFSTPLVSPRSLLGLPGPPQAHSFSLI